MALQAPKGHYTYDPHRQYVGVQQLTPTELGCNAVTLATGANVLTAEIENATSRERYMDYQVSVKPIANPTAGGVCRFYVVNQGQLGWDTGSASVDPHGVPFGSIVFAASTTVQVATFNKVPVGSLDFKVVNESAISTAATLSAAVKLYS